MHHVDRHAIGTSGNHGEGGNDSSGCNREGAARGCGHPRHLPHHGRSSPIKRDPSSPLLAALIKTVEQTTGAPAQVSYFTGYTDAAVIAETCSNHNCMSYGPGSLALAHKPNECVPRDDISASRRCLQTCCYHNRASHKIGFRRDPLVNTSRSPNHKPIRSSRQRYPSNNPPRGACAPVAQHVQ